MTFASESLQAKGKFSALITGLPIYRLHHIEMFLNILKKCDVGKCIFGIGTTLNKIS